MKNLDNEGVSQSILREISLVNSLTHPCIIKLITIIIAPKKKKKRKTIFFFLNVKRFLDIGECEENNLIYVISELFEIDLGKYMKQINSNAMQMQLKV